MALLKFTQRLIKMNDLLISRNTGTAEQFARKIGISRRQIQLDMEDLLDLDIGIKYDYYLKSYIYDGQKTIVDLFRIDLN